MVYALAETDRIQTADRQQTEVNWLERAKAPLFAQTLLRTIAYDTADSDEAVLHPRDWQLLFHAADPHVSYDQHAGLYRVTCMASVHTRENSVNDIVVRSAPSLTEIGQLPDREWNKTTEQLLKVCGECELDEHSLPCNKQVWAPELNIEPDGSYTLRVSMSNGQNETHDVYVYQAPTLDDTFQFLGRVNIPTRHWAIDGTVMNDIRMYMWSGWEDPYSGYDQGQHIYMSKLLSPTHISGDRKKLFSPTLPWMKSSMAILEGVQGAEHQGITWGGTLSANISWGTEYTTGVFYRDEKEDPEDTAAWVLDPKPLFSGLYGGGHGGFVPDYHDPDYFFFLGHTKLFKYQGWEDRAAFLTKYKADEVLERRHQVLRARPKPGRLY